MLSFYLHRCAFDISTRRCMFCYNFYCTLECLIGSLAMARSVLWIFGLSILPCFHPLVCLQVFLKLVFSWSSPFCRGPCIVVRGRTVFFGGTLSGRVTKNCKKNDSRMVVWDFFIELCHQIRQKLVQNNRINGVVISCKKLRIQENSGLKLRSKCSYPIRLQDSLIINICERSQSIAFKFFVEVAIKER